jgi:hypothetical protein
MLGRKEFRPKIVLWGDRVGGKEVHDVAPQGTSSVRLVYVHTLNYV